MITVYGHPNTRSVRVVWLLEEMNQPYEYHLVDFAKGESQSELYLALNPGGKVPSIKDNDLLLTESAAILNYLSEKYGSGDLAPKPGTAERAHYDEICFFVMTELEQPLWSIAKHKFALPKGKRVPEIFETAQWEFQKACSLLSKKLGENQFLANNKFSCADILAGQTLLWGLAFKQPIEQANLVAYIERISERDALKAARAKESGKN
jgi:glutathione S-transferase